MTMTRVLASENEVVEIIDSISNASVAQSDTLLQTKEVIEI